MTRAAEGNLTAMDTRSQADRARAFRKLHNRSSLLLLPNAWDAGSARLFAKRGFSAIATTSAGMAWSLGYADGEHAPLGEVLAALARITRAVDVPVTADLETGYGETPDAVAATVRAAIAVGVVGVNLEDGTPGHGPLRSIDEAAARLRAARMAANAAGVPLVLNARVDAWMQPGKVRPAARLEDALARAEAYLAAGADSLFPLGLSEPATLEAFVHATDAPVNVAAGPGMPDLAELARLGVARVSTASRFAALALAAADHAATALRETGRSEVLASPFGYPDAQRLFAEE